MKLPEPLNKLLDFFWIKAFHKLQNPIPIHQPGEYGKGFYRLARDITIDENNGLKFINTAVLDLNGKTISNPTGMNEWNYGILSEKRIKIYSRNTASIIGFRAGAKISGAGSSIKNIKFSKNRYIGIMIEADNCHIDGCIIDSTGGVNDEPYAIGIQVGDSKNTKVDRTTIKNIYKQPQYKGKNAGEGLGINFSANSISCEATNCTLSNDDAKFGTIGIFCGIRGGHQIRKNKISNFSCGIGAVSDAVSLIVKNSIQISHSIPESYGICAEISKVTNNIISGDFETKILCKNHCN